MARRRNQVSKLPAPYLKRVWLNPDKISDAKAYPFVLPFLKDGFEITFEHRITVIAGEGGAYDVALEAFDEVLLRYPEADSAPEAMRGLGIMQGMWAETLGEDVFDAAGERLFSAPAFHWPAAFDAND